MMGGIVTRNMQSKAIAKNKRNCCILLDLFHYELNTVHLHQRCSLFMPNKLVQLPVLTEVRAPSLLEQHSRYVPHRDRAGYERCSSEMYVSVSYDSQNKRHSFNLTLWWVFVTEGFCCLCAMNCTLITDAPLYVPNAVIKHDLTFRHRASCIQGQAFHYSPENALYIFNQQIYFLT